MNRERYDFKRRSATPLRPPTGRIASPIIVAIVMAIEMAGCGEKGERLIQLMDFEQVEEPARGPIYMQMVREYYLISTIDRTKLENNEGLNRIGDRLGGDEGANPEEMEALRALLRIQAIDTSSELALPAVRLHWNAAEVWERLSDRSRLAFQHWDEIEQPKNKK